MSLNIIKHYRAFVTYALKNTSEKIVYIALCDFAKDDGISFPSRKTLVEFTGLCDRQLTRTIVELERRGIIAVDRSFKKVSRYQILHNTQALLEQAALPFLPKGVPTDSREVTVSQEVTNSQEQTVSREGYRLTVGGVPTDSHTESVKESVSESVKEKPTPIVPKIGAVVAEVVAESDELPLVVEEVVQAEPAPATPEPAKAKGKGKSKKAAEKPTVVADGAEDEDAVAFEKWWEYYPPIRRTDKPRALSIWKRDKLTNKFMDMIRALHWQKYHWSDNDYKFTPGAARYLDEQKYLEGTGQQPSTFYYENPRLETCPITNRERPKEVLSVAFGMNKILKQHYGFKNKEYFHTWLPVTFPSNYGGWGPLLDDWVWYLPETLEKFETETKLNAHEQEVKFFKMLHKAWAEHPLEMCQVWVPLDDMDLWTPEAKAEFQRRQDNDLRNGMESIKDRQEMASVLADFRRVKVAWEKLHPEITKAAARFDMHSYDDIGTKPLAPSLLWDDDDEPLTKPELKASDDDDLPF